MSRCQVTIISPSGRVMPKEEPEASELVRKALDRDGVRLLAAKLLKVDRQEGVGQIIYLPCGCCLNRRHGGSSLQHISRDCFPGRHAMSRPED